MKLITLISLYILFSGNYGEEVNYSPEFNQELEKPITIEGSNAAATITFKKINLQNEDIRFGLEDIIYLTLKDIKANVKSKFKIKTLFGKRNASAKGEIKITINMTFKDEYKNPSDDGKYFKATMTDLKIDIDLNSVYGDLKDKRFNKVAESLKKQIKEQILKKFEQKKLEKIIVSDFEGFFNMYN